MTTTMRQSTLETLGLGSVLEIFRKAQLPVSTSDLVDQVFGPSGDRGALVISGGKGIVGAGKAMQLGSRLLPYDVPLITLDLPGAPDGLSQQAQGLEETFGAEMASRIMANITQLTYDGQSLPSTLKRFNPRFLLEAIPEIMDLKQAHYKLFRAAFPEIQIRSVTSGFPQSELGVGITHPAFPHQINKVWEVVEPEPSPITHLLWALGLMPIPVSDNWSFVLDVLFCGLTLAGSRYCRATNMPYWKADKYIRELLGPNPFRAHDAIGAAGANFLTHSCLRDLTKQYGRLFQPTRELVDRKNSGQNWYPLDHARPIVNWPLDDEDEFSAYIQGALFQMVTLLLHEQRSHLAHINAIGELCAQFRHGILSVMRSLGPEGVVRVVEAYHQLHPEAAKSCWHPDTLNLMESPEWQQLYVNAEHDGEVGVITISRESYNGDVDTELNRAIDWLLSEGVESVIVTGDFHLSTQMVGADTSEFFSALDDVQEGARVSQAWSTTARRLHFEFKISVGFIGGKRCLGGMLELLTHCHYLVAVNDAKLGMPEVTLPVVPGMEGCHWPFRRAERDNWGRLMELLLSGKLVRADKAECWLVDYAGSMEEALRTAWALTHGTMSLVSHREKLEEGAISDLPQPPASLEIAGSPAIEAARRAIAECVHASCAAPLSEALLQQADHSAAFMVTEACRQGEIGKARRKTNVS